MKRVKAKLTIPQYRERKEIIEALGYKEISYIEKRYYAKVTLEIDENMPHYAELRALGKRLYAKGPSFAPILLLVIVAFILLSSFVMVFAKEKSNFDLLSNALAFILPAVIVLLLDVGYTYYYFVTNKRIIDQGVPKKDEILKMIEEIKSK